MIPNQVVKRAIWNPDTQVWEEGENIIIILSAICTIEALSDHAVIYTADGRSTVIMPSAVQVKDFLDA